MDETMKQQLRKKILDLKPETAGFYTELYNLVDVVVKLNPDAFVGRTAEILAEKMASTYSSPGKRHKMSLPQLEQLYSKYKDDPNVRIRSKLKVNMSDVKCDLDRVRRDLLFFLALVEDRPRNYDIVLEKVSRIDAGKVKGADADAIG